MRHAIFALNDRGSIEVLSPPALVDALRQGRLCAFVVVRVSSMTLWRERIPQLLRFLAGRENSVMLLVDYRPPPKLTPRRDPPVESYACSSNALSTQNLEPATLLSVFRCLRELLEGSRNIELTALQSDAPLPEMKSQPGLKDAGRLVWIIPHAGPPSLLARCLQSVLAANAAVRGDVLVGIDEPVPQNLLSQYTALGVSFFASSIPRSGPYLLRNELIRRSDAALAIFQDSDDVPCADRVQRLVATLQENEASMSGSHEIRVDELTSSCYAVRYPLDVSEGLRFQPRNVALHPTTIVRVCDFLRTGAFNTAERHSMDLQFLLRSYFHFKTVNSDSFLYIRRIRRGSLTTDLATARDSLPRVRLRARWERDFCRVRKGDQQLERSSLAPCSEVPPGYDLRPLEPQPTPSPR